jgi:glycosyltransferase involved in cell wall biosynthesis
MGEPLLRVRHVNTLDGHGGAAGVASSLCKRCRQRGHESVMTVQQKVTDDDFVSVLDSNAKRGFVARKIMDLASALESTGNWPPQASRVLRGVAQPWRAVDLMRGFEDFDYPSTYELASGSLWVPNIIHCHNLHGGFFDLRALASLSARVPIVLTLHDAWLLSGHCAHSFECDRWRIGCGKCPDLNIYPAIRRDATAQNWRKKRDIYLSSRLYIATPSEWLMRRVKQSILAAACVESRVIPNGVDVKAFSPGPAANIRLKLGIGPDTKMLLFIADHARQNPFKDYDTLRSALDILSERCQDLDILFVALGDTGSDEIVHSVNIRLLPFTDDASEVANLLRATDLYVHAARADTFPSTIIEALATGTPVVATSVGGIPEQIRGLEGASHGWPGPFDDSSSATGILTSQGDADEMASAIELLLRNADLRQRLAENAVRDARLRFDIESQVTHYIDWYHSILQSWQEHEKTE